MSAFDVMITAKQNPKRGEEKNIIKVIIHDAGQPVPLHSRVCVCAHARAVCEAAELWSVIK